MTARPLPEPELIDCQVEPVEHAAILAPFKLALDIAAIDAADRELNLLLKWRCDWVGLEIKVSDVLNYVASRRNEIWHAKDRLTPKGK